MKSPVDPSSPASPMNKLSDGFGHLVFDENQQQRMLYKAMHQAGYHPAVSKLHPKNDIMRPESRNGFEISPTQPQDNTPGQQQSTQNCDQTLDMFKAMDNFYMNYSNSPLSSDRIIKDASNKSAGNRFTREFDSFSEMINALQKKSSEEIRDEIHIPRPLRFNTAQKLQETIEARMNSEENCDLKGTIENAALDTFRTVVDAQLLLCDALKKANFLNNLVQLKKTKEPSQKPPE
jgi:hypothetical protein